MTQAQIFEKIRENLVELLGVNPEEVTMEASFLDDLNADSLDIVDLVLQLEKEFNFQIPDDDAELIKTVGDAVRYIEANL